MECTCSSDSLQSQCKLHSVYTVYTAGALQFKLGPYKGRWAHFNVKLHFYKINLPTIIGIQLLHGVGENIVTLYKPV